MKRQRFYFALVCILLMNAVCTDSFAQVENAMDAVGKIYYQETVDSSWAKLFAAQSSVSRSGYYKPLMKYVAEICNIVTDVSAVKPPKGFNIKPVISESARKFDKIYPNRVLPYMDVTFCNYVLYTDKRTNKIKQAGRWDSSIELFVNDPKFLLTYDNSIARNCDSVGIPTFYYKPKMHKDRNGYWVLVPDHIFNEIRIVKRADVPLYIPLTQREYLEYKLKLHQRSLVSDKAKQLPKKNFNTWNIHQISHCLNRILKMRIRILEMIQKRSMTINKHLTHSLQKN